MSSKRLSFPDDKYRLGICTGPKPDRLGWRWRNLTKENSLVLVFFFFPVNIQVEAS